MAVDMSFLVADRDYYAPWDRTGAGRPYDCGPMPSDWSRRDSGIWTHWSPTVRELPDQGWKVHVSSSLDNTQAVLAVVAAIAVEFGVSFKHLTGRRTFLLLHGKHAPRVQAGKFCALYPTDVEQARSLLERLETDLTGVAGPYVLTDRRFGASACVSYRYGAFVGRARVDAEGYPVHVMAGPDGAEIVDERAPSFRLPAGLIDPFRPEPAPATSTGRVSLHGYSFDKVLQHSNAGGAYKFRSEQGETVFAKEAKAHNGYTEDGADAKTRLVGEYLTLRAVHARDPGLCPRPIELFEHWEHSYLVTEWIPGTSLYHWMVTNNPALQVRPDAAGLAHYHQRCLHILDQLTALISRLHAIGFVFVDLSPNNVLVDEADHVRLIDFEAVQPSSGVRTLMGTPGYQHPDGQQVARDDPQQLDWYGLSALALLLLFTVHEAADRNPATLSHVRADLTEIGPIPSRLWQLATRFRPAAAAGNAAPGPRSTDPSGPIPDPATVRADPAGSLRELAERTADALEAMADPDRPGWVYPTNPQGHQTNTLALASGTAGVLHALHVAGRSCDPVIVRRLRDDALAAARTLAPGFLFGSAGIATVLAELGEVEAAESLLQTAARHPLNDRSASFGGGAAGTALGLLLQHARTGEQRWLELARHLLAALPEGDALSERLSRSKPSGLVNGRPGVALALYYLHRWTGEDRFFDQGLRLLGQELAFAEPMRPEGLRFRPALGDPRVYPYLFAGSAGYAAVLTRYLAERPSAEFNGKFELTAGDALERALLSCQIRFTAYPGLFPGLAGLAVVLSDAGRRLDRPDLCEAAARSARGLFRYAIAHAGGIGWLGEPGQRLSAELWSGSAGVLLALHRLNPATPGLFEQTEVCGSTRR